MPTPILLQSLTVFRIGSKTSAETVMKHKNKRKQNIERVEEKNHLMPYNKSKNKKKIRNG